MRKYIDGALVLIALVFATTQVNFNRDTRNELAIMDVRAGLAERNSRAADAEAAQLTDEYCTLIDDLQTRVSQLEAEDHRGTEIDKALLRHIKTLYDAHVEPQAD